MDFDATVQEGLRRSNARFVASMTRIIEQYNRPFKDDVLISIASLTYDTSDGPKQWDKVSRKDVKTWKKKILKCNRRSPRHTDKKSCDFQDEHSTVVDQESSENPCAVTSDTGEESGDIASVGRKFEGIHLKNLNVDDGQTLKKKRVPVDVIVQGDERNIPKWITITTPSSSKSRRSTLPGQELLGEESGDIASVGRKFEGIHLKNLNVDDGQTLKKKRVPVDVIVQGDERNIPKWITITTPSSSKSRRSTLPGQELLGTIKSLVCWSNVFV
ncbi:Holliday junction recognition protein [Motacilla alba alba]|uniref:Holliday junction recognition protein n=1 Tax=Motacilla alba alba TaxID=1094192 RepID=UPI0018D4E505|nr:Holliday junction recognition protein [Motacilla alba alba]